MKIQSAELYLKGARVIYGLQQHWPKLSGKTKLFPRVQLRENTASVAWRFLSEPRLQLINRGKALYFAE